MNLNEGVPSPIPPSIRSIPEGFGELPQWYGVILVVAMLAIGVIAGILIGSKYC